MKNKISNFYFITDPYPHPLLFTSVTRTGGSILNIIWGHSRKAVNQQHLLMMVWQEIPITNLTGLKYWAARILMSKTCASMPSFELDKSPGIFVSPPSSKIGLSTLPYFFTHIICLHMRSASKSLYRTDVRSDGYIANLLRLFCAKKK